MISALPTAEFFARDALLVARDLLGMLLVHGDVILRITEVEAYRWPGDSANHAFRGPTPRSRPMWGPGGHAYVYRCYGIHSLLNVVTNPVSEAAAVLIRSAEPIAGQERIAERRRQAVRPNCLAGPGKVTEALAIDTRWSGHCLYHGDGLSLATGKAPARLLCGPRIGIHYATPHDRAVPWRLADADSLWVSHRAHLKPYRG